MHKVPSLLIIEQCCIFMGCKSVSICLLQFHINIKNFYSHISGSYNSFLMLNLTLECLLLGTLATLNTQERGVICLPLGYPRRPPFSRLVLASFPPSHLHTFYS
jgi:hypothetical protein